MNTLVLTSNHRLGKGKLRKRAVIVEGEVTVAVAV